MKRTVKVMSPQLIDMPLTPDEKLTELRVAASRGDFAAKVRLECHELAELLIAKNKAYGNSALEPVRIFSQADAVEQIKVRLDDKISRLVRGQAAGEDVTQDLLGYLILLRIAERAGKAGQKP